MSPITPSSRTSNANLSDSETTTSMIRSVSQNLIVQHNNDDIETTSSLLMTDIITTPSASRNISEHSSQTNINSETNNTQIRNSFIMNCIASGAISAFGMGIWIFFINNMIESPLAATLALGIGSSLASCILGAGLYVVMAGRGDTP